MRSRMHSAAVLALSFACGCVFSNQSHGEGLGDLSGSGEMSAVDVRADGIERQTLRQRWTARFDRNLTPYLRLGAGARFQRFDLDELDLPGTFQAQWQPSAELDWRHPRFSLRSSYTHRQEELSAADGLLMSDAVEAAFRTRNRRGPVLRTYFSLLDREDHRSFDPRESSDRTARVSAEWSSQEVSTKYTFTDRDTKNLISDLSSQQRDHRLQLDGSWRTERLWDSTLQLQTNFYRASRSDDVLDGNILFERIQVSEGLYARDLTPTTDPLESAPTLVDGDRRTAATPTVDIGGSSTDQNLGADLGFERPVAAVQVFTDRISADTLVWDIYVSDDNIDWSSAGSAIASFDRTQLRYDLIFPPMETRYLKVVNRTGNEVAEVLVTEVEFFEGQEGVRSRSRSLSGGRVIARWAQRPTSSLATSIESSIQSDPGTSRVGRNNQFTITTRASYDRSPATRHSLRWSQTNLRFAGARENLREDQVAYGFLWEPSTRMAVRSSADARFTHTAARRSLEIYTAATQARVQLLPDLRLAMVPAISRRHDYDSGQSSDQWSMSVTMEATPYQSFSTTSAWRHQEIVRDSGGIRAPSRDMIDAAATLRITPAFQLRSRWVWIQDDQRSSRHDHLASWQLSRRLRLSGSGTIEDSSENRHSLRYTVSANFDLSRRTTTYVRFTMNDLRRAEGIRSETFEQGFRTTF